MEPIFRCLGLIVILFLFSNCSAKEKVKDIVPFSPNNLKLLGEKFGQEVQEAYKIMSKADSQRYYDLTPICEKYFPVGTSIADATEILIGAGARPDKIEKTIWAPAYNHSLPRDSVDRNDISAGFILRKTLISNAQFGVFIRPQSIDGSFRNIGKIVACRVLEVSI
jgi:hypothetical protein